MTWRPEGWETLRQRLWMPAGVSGYWIDKDSANAIRELGADAMLEALKKEAEYVDPGYTCPYGLVLGRKLKRGEKGWLLFISDDPSA